MTEAHVCEQLVQGCYVASWQRNGRQSNLQPLEWQVDALIITSPGHTARRGSTMHATVMLSRV